MKMIECILLFALVNVCVSLTEEEQGRAGLLFIVGVERTKLVGGDPDAGWHSTGDPHSLSLFHA